MPVGIIEQLIGRTSQLALLQKPLTDTYVKRKGGYVLVHFLWSNIIMAKKFTVEFIPAKPGSQLCCVRVKGHPDPARNGKHYVTQSEAVEVFKSVAFEGTE
jgi:hypothetical protein